MSWRITHVDATQYRRVMLLQCATQQGAAALATALYGEALYLAVIRLPEVTEGV